MNGRDNIDILFVGGGLANTLAAWRLSEARPTIRWHMLETGSHVGGTDKDRTWSFHAADLEGWRRFGLASDGQWLRRLESKTWPGYRVTFPRLARAFHGDYCSIRSLDLHQKFVERHAANITFNQPVRSVSANSVTLADGNTLSASMVIDGRGFGSAWPAPCAYQKFYGMNLSFERPHGVDMPLLMDARIPQTDGYRFFYLLPWSATDLLVEDTYYSDTPEVDVERCTASIRDYVQRHINVPYRVIGDERGTLPIPLAGAASPLLPRGTAVAGVASGRYHPTTGYSVAEAARFAERLSTVPQFNPATADMLNAESSVIWRRGNFLRRLNNMMFLAGAAHDRWQIMERFHERGEGLIQRFYRGDVRYLDRLAILSGKPPVPVIPALRAFCRRAQPTAQLAATHVTSTRKDLLA